MAATNKSVVDGSLRIINAAREACGEPLLEFIPYGVPGEPTLCPIARSLPDDPSVGIGEVYFAEQQAADALAEQIGVEAIFKSGYKARHWCVAISGTPLATFVQRFDSDSDSNRDGITKLIGERR